jgi:competence protein ComEC
MDDIQRKLDLIDRQLAGRPNFVERTISTSPLVFVALGLIAGILIQNALFESQATSPESRVIWLWLAMLGICAAAAILIFAVYKEGKIASYSPVLLSACALICFTCLGAIRLAGFYQARPDDIRNFVDNKKGLATENTEKKINYELTQTDTNKRADDELVRIRENSWQKSADSATQENDAKLATIRGVIITEPYVQDNNDWRFARFQFTDPASSFYLEVSEVETAGGWAKVSGTVRVQVDGPVLDLKAGDYIQIYCWLNRFGQPTNPGQFNTAEYLARKGVFVAASVPSRDAIELLKKNSSTGTFIKLKRRLQEIAGQALRGDLDVEGQNYALLQALVLGYRTKIDSDTYRAFQKTGLLHFICLSGMNFAILIGIIWWLCKTAGLMKRARAVICLAAAGIFLLVVPPNSPAIRAGIMCLAFCSSFFFRRKSNPFNMLSLAAVILLLIRPTYLFEADWQLSFASVLGILFFAGPIGNFINEKVIALLENPATGKPRPYSHIVSILTSPVIAVFSVSLAAWLATAGILLYQFYTINYLTSIWTVIVSPLIGVISVVGYVKIVLGLFLPSAAALLDMVIRPLSDLLIWVVKLFAGWNISNILIGKTSSIVIILYYAFLVSVFFNYFSRPLVRKLVCTAIALVIIVSLGSAKWQRIYRDDLVLTCLDVGHGQAILAQLPGKTNILFDAGSLQRANVGGRIIAPFLDYSGISKIDAIVISHKDIDHINGIPEIVEHCKVGAVYADKVFFDEAQKGGAAKFLNDYLTEKGLKKERLDGGLNLLNSHANIKILWPNSQIPEEKLSDNDKSLVLLIQFAGVKMLLCSDIEKFAQTQLLQTIPDLKADIVIVPHHGSTITSDAAFLEKLGPDILIVSCDRTQYERRLAAGRKNIAKLFYTARDGAIAVRINKAGTIDTATFAKQ